MCFMLNVNSKTEVPYPESYRTWRHIKSGVIGPNSPIFKVEGGFHHIYANDKAIKGYETGKFEEGSVLVFDKLEMIEDKDGNMLEGNRIRVDVMVKNHVYDSTGGWGFERFKGDSKLDRMVLNLSRAKCFNCHESQKQAGFVFSKLRK